ncbi:MAG: hypothetical protein KC418_08560 [Anaerolineales bacterium]|nr:hypothetical protein [Anaerolineales bacterium]
MVSRNVFRLLLPLTCGLLVVMLGWQGLRSTAQATAAPQAATAFTRADEPIVVTGADLPQLTGSPIDELGLYALQSGIWVPIPFQVDEVNITGTYVIEEDGLLDENDELVFLADDTGAEASNDQWVGDLGSLLYPRVSIQATDPLYVGEEGWVYLYRSSTLAKSTVSYISWDADTETIAATNYSASFDQTNFIGLSTLSINGSGDILDRQKVRVDVTPLGMITEDDLAMFLSQLGLPSTLTVAALGPIRAATGNLAVGIGFAFYGSRIDLDLTFPLSDTVIVTNNVQLPLQFQSAFTSLDLLNPTQTGMAPATYYDPNVPAGVAIDGAADSVPVSPWHNYSVVSGQVGTIVDVMEVDRGQGHIRNYYIDNSTIDDADTGDRKSFGNAGIGIERSNANTEIGMIQINQRFYILTGPQGNVGPDYVTRTDNPFTTTTVGEVNPDANFIFLPVNLRP